MACFPSRAKSRMVGFTFHRREDAMKSAFRLLSFCAALLAAVSFLNTAHAQRTPLAIAGGAPGGAFAEYAPAIARVVAAHSKLDLIVRNTDGSNENLRLVNAGTVPLALVNLGPAYQAWTGTAPFAGPP